jgi:NAD+ diphosphatase
VTSDRAVDTAAATFAAEAQPGLPPGAHAAPGTRVDRAAHRRTDEAWLAGAWTRARVVPVSDGRLPVQGDPARLVLLDPADTPDSERYFLGHAEDGTPYFAVAARVPVPEGARMATLREVGHELDAREADLFVTAVALVNWHARHAFSPQTGRPTTVAEAGWTRVTDDGEILFPRTDPAVIVVVHDGVAGPRGRCLLGHNAAWTTPGWTRRYSCLAGFVEPGESAEATVAREIAEEVGVTVTDVRYVASQAWPFPGSLMLGFSAVADPAQPVRVDAAEIADARWFTRTEIAAALAGDETDFGLPMAASIANYLIRSWLAAPVRNSSPASGP